MIVSSQSHALHILAIRFGPGRILLRDYSNFLAPQNSSSKLAVTAKLDYDGTSARACTRFPSCVRPSVHA